jgi:hypothetical protein
MARARLRSSGMLAATAAVVMACAGSTATRAPGATSDPTAPAAPSASSVSAVATASASPPIVDDGPAAPAASSQAAASASPALKLSVLVHPATRVTSDQARDMYLSFELTNTGSESVKADIGDSVLLVNGKPLKQWASTMAELGPAERAKNLAPKETMRFHFKFAKKVVVKPGEYTFEISVGARRSDRVVVTVTP